MLRFVLVMGMLLASEAFAPRARTVRGRAALYARDPERAARFKAQTLSRATDAKARATARAEGRPMEPEREAATIKVADFSDADYARNGFIRKVLFGVAGAAFIGLELETLAVRGSFFFLSAQENLCSCARPHSLDPCRRSRLMLLCRTVRTANPKGLCFLR